MKTSSVMLNEIMMVTAILAAVLSAAASILNSRGASRGTVSILHFSGYGLMFLSIVLFIIIGIGR